MSVSGWIFASLYDRLTRATEAAGLSDHRHHLLHNAVGRVLEIGAGTGANLPHYTAAAASVTLTEPEPAMARRLERKLAAVRQPFTIVSARAERLPFDAGEFDTVVATLVLCTVPDQAAALAEIRRALKPGGHLLFIEHVRSGNPRVAAWQDRLNRINRIVAHGCNCNRPTADAIAAAGFRIDTIVNDELPKAPPILRPLIVGTARRD